MNLMTCSNCKALDRRAKDGLCRSCRLRGLVASFRRYTWTPEMDAQLTRVYRSAKGKTELSLELSNLSRRYSMPRYIIWNRSNHLGLRQTRLRKWQKDEIQTLHDLSGEVSVSDLAKRLGRSYLSIKQKLFELDLQGRVTEGYSQRELRDLLGVPHATLGRWIAKGWLHLDVNARVTTESIERFVWDHMEEYRFSAAEEWWLKTMLKPSIGRMALGGKPAKKVA